MDEKEIERIVKEAVEEVTEERKPMRYPEETVSYDWAVEAMSEIMDRGTQIKVTTFDASWMLSILFPFREKEETMDDLVEYRRTRVKE